MMKKLLIVSFLISLVGCQGLPSKSDGVAQISSVKLNSRYAKVLLEAENKATPEGRKVLATGREMALIDRAIIKGSCWDYASAIFDRAGYPYSTKRAVIINNKKVDPLAVDFKSIQPGDFLSYVNHSFNDIKHSAIFVDWIDFDKKIGLMLSYAGQHRKEPARYKPYDLSDVYYVARARS